ncbi:MAG: hypothetical protein JRI68_00730 [Deltaproteobacteria bacterium]|nr:hypothetical protein [Deltaproteobacteria bacterium]
MTSQTAGVRWVALLGLTIPLWGCGDESVEPAAQLTAGAAEVVITPTTFETYTDLDGDHEFDGELDHPAGDPDNGIEPFDDDNGNGVFDGAWLAGGGTGRAANLVHDDLMATAVVFSDGQTTVAFLGVDSLGLPVTLHQVILDKLAERGVTLDLLLMGGSHSHEAPDPLGVFGPTDGITGIDTDYFDFVTDRAAEVLAEAQAARAAATLTLAATQSPLEVGQTLQYDRRDPNVIDNDLGVMRFDDAADGSTIATVVNWANHPEFLMDFGWISADYVGFLREQMTDAYPGSTCVFLNGALGGQIGATHAQFTYDGVSHGDGDSEEKMEAVGRYAADLALEALSTEGRPQTDFTITAAATEKVLLPVDNIAFRAMFNLGVFVYHQPRNADGTFLEGKATIGTDFFVESEVVYLRMGELELLSAPGEVHPELVVGGHDGSRADPNFPFVRDDNPNPSDMDDAPDGPYWKDYLTAPVKLYVGMGNDELGYIVAPFNFALHPDNPWLEEWTDHHYEETYSLGPETADVIDAAYRKLTGQP